MSKLSAGLLVYRRRPVLQVLLGHPGGPFYARKDLGAWSIPKGEVEPGETLSEAARREFLEETGIDLDGTGLALTPVRLRGGKVIHAWAVEAECNPEALVSATFELEWPRRSGRVRRYPELDVLRYFAIEEARTHMHPSQTEWLDELTRLVATLDRA